MFVSFTNKSDNCCQTVGDFDKDNCLDIVVTNYGAENIGIFFGNSSGSFSSQKTITSVPKGRKSATS